MIKRNGFNANWTNFFNPARSNEKIVICPIAATGLKPEPKSGFSREMLSVLDPISSFIGEANPSRVVYSPKIVDLLVNSWCPVTR